MNISDFLKIEYNKRNWSVTTERSLEQIDAIERLVKGENLLLNEPTSWGKTAVFALATKYFREQGLGPSIIIYPTLELINSQISELEKFGLRCKTLNHTNKETHQEIYESIKQNQVDAVMVSPEKATDDYFIKKLNSFALCVADEAHCISDLGHDFRPSYKQLYKLITSVNNARILGTTATIDSNDVLLDITEQLGDLNIIRGNMEKPNLSIEVVTFPEDAEETPFYKTNQIWWLHQNILNIVKKYGPIAIFCTKKETVEAVYDRLNVFNLRDNLGLHIGIFYANDNFPREMIMSALKNREIDVVVCTGASLGIGVDVNFGATIHYDLPIGGISQLYQEIGRAGRDKTITPNAKSYILYSPDTLKTAKKAISSNGIQKAYASEILAAVHKGITSIDDIVTNCPTLTKPTPAFYRTLNILLSSEALKYENNQYVAGSHSLEYAIQRDEIVKQRRKDAFDTLVSTLLSNDTCLMQQIRITLGDATPNTQPCGKCSVCRKNNL